MPFWGGGGSLSFFHLTASGISLTYMGSAQVANAHARAASRSARDWHCGHTNSVAPSSNAWIVRPPLKVKPIRGDLSAAAVAPDDSRTPERPGWPMGDDEIGHGLHEVSTVYLDYWRKKLLFHHSEGA